MKRPMEEAYLETAICERLRLLRLKRQAEHVRNGNGVWDNPFTQKAVAKRLGVSAVCVWRWENDLRYHPRSLERFEKWASLLGTTFVAELIAVIDERMAA